MYNIYMYKHEHAHIFIHKLTHVCTHSHMYAPHICTLIHTHIYTLTHVCAHTHIYMCTHTCIHTYSETEELTAVPTSLQIS